jgi:hypothetical protein
MDFKGTKRIVGIHFFGLVIEILTRQNTGAYLVFGKMGYQIGRKLNAVQFSQSYNMVF